MTKPYKLLLLIAFSVVAFSCSKDDDATPEKSLEDVTMSLSGSSSIVTPPTAMASSDNTYAMQASGYVSLANAMSGYLQYFKPPQGAVKSSTAITTANGRAAAAQTEYLVYTWTDSQGSGLSLAYQVSEQSGKYVFEIFIKFDQGDDWMRYVYAEEAKDGSEGLMRIFGAMYGSDDLMLNYSWKHTGDLFEFVMSSDADASAYEVSIKINTKTKAGSVEYVIDGALMYNMTWDAAGNGTWTYYIDGEIYESGSWNV